MLIVKILTYWFLASAAILVLLWIVSEIDIAIEDRSYRKQAQRGQKSALTPEDLMMLIETSERIRTEENNEAHA